MGPLFYETSDYSIFGTRNKREIWNKLLFYLALLGRSASHEHQERIDVTNNQCRVASRGSVEIYGFENCHIFDTSGISVENEVDRMNETKFRVIDDLEIRNMSRDVREIKSFSFSTDFVKEVHFYTSGRIDGAKHVTDCVSESVLSKEQIYEFDYSDTMVKFKIQKALIAHGFNGRIAGVLKNGKNKFLKPELTHTRRIVQEVPDISYRDSENIRFLSKNLGQIIDEATTQR